MSLRLPLNNCKSAVAHKNLVTAAFMYGILIPQLLARVLISHRRLSFLKQRTGFMGLE
jgi:hypothetical protein